MKWRTASSRTEVVEAKAQVVRAAKPGSDEKMLRLKLGSG